jgi:acetylornithine deacetylase
MPQDEQNSTLELLTDFISIDSQSHKASQPVFDAAANALEGWDLEYVDYQDAAGTPKRNLVARHPGSRSDVAFAGHLDTVSSTGWTRDPFKATIEGQRLYGLGASDMKGPIASFIIAANSLPDADRPMIVLTSDEESGKQGVREVVANSTTLKEFKPACFIVAEPTALGILRGHRVDVAFSIHAQGIQAHSSTGRGVNANIALVPFLSEMRELHLHLRTNPALFDLQYDPPYCDLNFVIDNYGAFPNMTVGLATCHIKFRYSKSFNPDIVINRVREAAERNNLKVQVRPEAPPPELAADHPLVKRAEEIVGVTAQVAGLGTEASEYSKIAPCLVFGPGDINHAHKPTEYIDLPQLNLSTHLFRKIATQLQQS